MKDDLISLPLHIPPDALVLDVGSGHKPHPRADVLCDKFLDDNAERGFDLVVDRPLVAGDVQNLPFRSDAFDFIITRHILEHVESPDAFLLKFSASPRPATSKRPPSSGSICTRCAPTTIGCW